MFTYDMTETIKVCGIVTGKEVKKITDKQHKLFTNNKTLKWFRNIGGKEILKNNKLTSISPDGSTVIVRLFKPISPNLKNCPICNMPKIRSNKSIEKCGACYNLYEIGKEVT